MRFRIKRIFLCDLCGLSGRKEAGAGSESRAK
jgi:hypothetical protein